MFARVLGALIGAALSLLPVVVAAEPPPIFVGGQFIRQHAIEDERGHLLVPVRGVFEAFGAVVEYTPPRIVVVRKGQAIIAGMVIGRRTAIVANRRRDLEAAPIRLGRRVYVPLRGVAEIAGATVQYSSRPRLVDIRLPNNEFALAAARRADVEIPPDPAVPPWALALIGAAVLCFLVEIARRVLVGRPRRAGRPPAHLPAALALSAPRLQLPYATDARDQHGVGEIAK